MRGILGVAVLFAISACDAGAAPPKPAPSPVVAAPPAPIDASVVLHVDPPIEKPAPIVDPRPTPVATAPKHEPGSMVVIIDRSGSMQGAKLDTAKDATRAVVEVLEPTDEITVITFDSEASLVVPLQKATNKKQIEAAIASIVPGGGTNILPGLQQAMTSLHGSKLTHKHVVLLTDGEAPTDGIANLLKDAEPDHITVSTVGVQGADRNMLAMISDAGGGRLYMVEDVGALPRIFLKEVKEAFKR